MKIRKSLKPSPSYLPTLLGFIGIAPFGGDARFIAHAPFQVSFVPPLKNHISQEIRPGGRWEKQQTKTTDPGSLAVKNPRDPMSDDEWGV